MLKTDKKNDALKNYLLAALSIDDFEHLRSSLEPVFFELGEILFETGDERRYVYFPTTAIISLQYITEDGRITEIGFIGNDGIVGISSVLGGKTMPHRAIIQGAGKAFRMDVKNLKAEFALSHRFQKLLLRYALALMTQISQKAVCNRLHHIEQHLCRWILFHQDRLASNKLVMTQELISNSLGCRRESITQAAQKLAAKKLIKTQRGRITIIDRQGLEADVCECYEIVKQEYNRLFGRGIARTVGELNS